MKKTLFLFIILFFTSFILIACGNGDADEANAEEDVKEESNPEVDEETVETSETEETETTEENEGSTGGGFGFEITEEDQLDLRVGDTGVLSTSLGSYEVTVESAEIVGSELDGEASLMDELIVIDLTFKNIGDNVLDAAEIMYSFQITEDLEASGFPNGAEQFESIEEFTGELQPGEERTTQFIGDIITSEEYYFRKDPGSKTSGTSNMVVWTITDEEAR